MTQGKNRTKGSQPAWQRTRLTRRGFVAASASLLAMVALQACRPSSSASGGARGAADGGATSEPEPPDDEVQTTTASSEPQAAPAAVAEPPAASDAASPAAQTAPTTLRGLVYLELPNPDAPDTIRPQLAELPRLVHETRQPWRLHGELVEVVNNGVLVDRDPSTGKLVGVPMGNAETASPDLFEFRPRNGGPLTWENEQRAGADNAWALEAARFGEVMAYFYADRVISYANELRAALGAKPLPFLRVVVNAHSASRLPGYRQNDGERLADNKIQPLAGGHYRLPTTRAAEIPFLHPIAEMNPTGEVHLGPGNSYITDSHGRNLILDGHPYLRNAAHVPGIIAHEVGHHVNSHTADFTANRLRKPNEYSNRKLHMDEGTADYWAAAILATPDIYNWQHAAEGRSDPENRDLTGPRTTDAFDPNGDPHRNGNIWASALWDVRRALGPRDTDLLVMKALLLCSQVGPSGSGDSAIQRVMEQKDELRDGLAMLIKADKELHGGQHRDRLLDIFKQRGIDLDTPDRQYGRD